MQRLENACYACAGFICHLVHLKFDSTLAYMEPSAPPKPANKIQSCSGGEDGRWVGPPEWVLAHTFIETGTLAEIYTIPGDVLS